LLTSALRAQVPLGHLLRNLKVEVWYRK